MRLKSSNVNGRHNVGRVDHVVLVYRNHENLKKAQQEFSTLLGIDDWDDFGEVFGRVHMVASWQSGIELIFPTKPDPAFDQHLATRGEGFFSLIFGVADLEQAMAQILKQGGTAIAHPHSPEQVYRTFEVAKEAVVGMVGGVNVTIGEFKPLT